MSLKSDDDDNIYIMNTHKDTVVKVIKIGGEII